jgi:hypothetical protein
MIAIPSRGVRRLALAGLVALLLSPASPMPVHAQALPQAPDPSAPGPYSVTKEEYEFGYTAIPSTALQGYTTNTNKIPGFGGPVELDGSVMYPSTAPGNGIPDKKDGPFPLIVFMHGRHSTAYAPQTVTLASGKTITAGAATSIWPPTVASGYSDSIPSYEGYDYASAVLASDGYIVVSIGVNGINAVDAGCRINVTATGASNAPYVTDAGALARAEVLQMQLDTWKNIDTIGDTAATTNVAGVPSVTQFGTRFVGFVDMTRIGTMGHSRGGEGVQTHAVYNSAAGFNPEVTTASDGTVIPAYPLKAVLALAPIDFNRYVVNGIPNAIIIPYCDGDVSDNQGIHFYDDERYNDPSDPTPKYFWTILGADHDLGNTVWTPSLFPYLGAPAGYGGTSEDWNNDTTNGQADPFAGNVPGATASTSPGRLVITNLLSTRLQPDQQQAIERNYFIAFFRTYIGHETQFLPFLRGDAAPPASSPAGQPIFETYQAPAALRMDLDTFLTANSLSVNALGGAVKEKGLTPFSLVGGTDAVPALRPLPGQPSARQPNNTPSNYNTSNYNTPLPGLTQLILGWSAPGAYLENDIPASDQNVSSYTALQFRAAVNFTDTRNRVLEDNFSVVLTDATGKTASVPVSQFSTVLMYPPGKVERLPKVELNGIRIPLTAFTGVDLTKITSVKFVFDRQSMGGILLTDVTFNKPTTTTAF